MKNLINKIKAWFDRMNETGLYVSNHFGGVSLVYREKLKDGSYKVELIEHYSPMIESE